MSQQTWEFGITKTIQTFIVPKDGEYSITCSAPRGGKGSIGKNGTWQEGGYGATVSSKVKLKAGQKLDILVGAPGGDASREPYSDEHYDKTTGGFGGSTGVFMDGLPLMVALGGVGGEDCSYKSHSNPNYTPSGLPPTPLNLLDRFPEKNPEGSIDVGHFNNYSYHTNINTYKKGDYSVSSGYGINRLFNYISMDDNSLIPNTYCNIVPGMEEPSENTSGESKVEINLLNEFTVTKPDFKSQVSLIVTKDSILKGSAHCLGFHREFMCLRHLPYLEKVFIGNLNLSCSSFRTQYNSGVFCSITSGINTVNRYISIWDSGDLYKSSCIDSIRLSCDVILYGNYGVEKFSISDIPITHINTPKMSEESMSVGGKLRLGGKSPEIKWGEIDCSSCTKELDIEGEVRYNVSLAIQEKIKL